MPDGLAGRVARTYMSLPPLNIGTSGWHYKTWKGPFYPDDMPARAFLAFYAGRFDTTEINNSFYRLPKVDTLRSWYETVPDDFVFSVKANRYITHMKKLKDPQDPLRNLYERITALEDKLGPILFQLPPNWYVNAERLEGFLQALSSQHRHVFEFREPTWYDDRVFELLDRYNAGFCVYELAGHISPLHVSADFAYVRLHGPDGAYQGSYSDDVLKMWLRRFQDWRRQGLETYCYFDNDEAGYAAQNALRMQQLAASAQPPEGN